MVKLRFLLMAVLMLAASTQMYAGWRVVVDKNCIKIVSSNLAAQKLIEEQHNARLRSFYRTAEVKDSLYLFYEKKWSR